MLKELIQCGLLVNPKLTGLDLMLSLSLSLLRAIRYWQVLVGLGNYMMGLISACFVINKE